MRKTTVWNTLAVLIAFTISCYVYSSENEDGKSKLHKEKPQPVRMSADDVVFPPSAERKLTLNLPILGATIGGPPENLAPKVFNVEASDRRLDLLRKHKNLPPRIDGEWFALRTARSDVVTAKLNRGLIVEQWYYFYSPQAFASAQKLRKLIGDKAGINTPDNWSTLYFKDDDTKIRVEFRGKHINADGSVSPGNANVAVLHIQVDPVHWYLLYNEVTPDIDQAMRTGKVIQGMSINQARLMFGEPDSVTVLEEQQTKMQWSFKSGYIGIPTPSGTRISGGKLKRILTVLADNGIITAVSDQHF